MVVVFLGGFGSRNFTDWEFRWSERIRMNLVEGSSTIFQAICDLPPGFYQVMDEIFDSSAPLFFFLLLSMLMLLFSLWSMFEKKKGEEKRRERYNDSKF